MADEFHSRVAQYTGKLLVKQGEKNGKAWQIWKILFDVGSQYPWSCKAFSSAKGFFSEDGQCLLKEGDYYKAVYLEEPFQSQFGEKVGRNIKIFELSSKDKVGESQPTARSAAKPEGPRKADNWVKFAEDYNTQMKDNPKANAMHMLGAYVANECGEEFKDLVILCKKNFAKKE